MQNPFASDGLLTRLGENIPLVNNGIQELHRRNGNGLALARARQTNPIGAHGAITRAAEHIPGVNNVVQAAHTNAGQPEALSRARGADPVGANGAVTRVAEHVPVVNSVVQALHERSGQESARQRAEDCDPLANTDEDRPDRVFELRHTGVASLAFQQRALANGTQCWDDRADVVFAAVPDELIGSIVFGGRLVSSLPASGVLSLSIGCPARVYLLAEAGPRCGGFSSLGWPKMLEDDHVHVTLNGETKLTVWSRDFEDSGTVGIRVQEPWVGCVAVRVLPDKGNSASKASPAVCSVVRTPANVSNTVGTTSAVASSAATAHGELTEAAARAQERSEQLAALQNQSQHMANSSAEFLQQCQALNRNGAGRQPISPAAQQAVQKAAQPTETSQGASSSEASAQPV